ncbi:MAG: HAD family hydrolase [Gemmatimonadota bacterium]|nr:HAD family hydrolase [Gemmatimonadota bacterium]
MQPTRIAMWSGPRNISTAMLRAWEHRVDTWVVDEPLYAHYLTQVAVAHPGVEEVIAHHETDWRTVVAGLTGPIPHGRSIYYQKQMAHHWLPHLRSEWVLRLTNAFLIRHPAEMLPSLTARMGLPTLSDTGLPQQVEILRFVRNQTGTTPPVLDAEDVLRDPRRALSGFCEAVGVPFSEKMLAWPAGRRETDGIWAKHWYEAVERSTGFEPYRPRDRRVSPELEPLLAECMPYYEELRGYTMAGRAGG